jgi:predicted dehydrogenase/threonine dehydrogenase-like Zn-dependent dehydrogenase
VKQILQNLKTGETMLAEVPCPLVKTEHLLIRTTASLVSVGTEKMLVDFGKANLIDKARQQPDKVRMVLNKVRTDGVLPTLEAMQNKLDQPLPLGYCNVGRVLEVGGGVSDFKVGDRVASNGWHTEVVCVPKNLCAKIPDSVSDEAAAFTVVGSIALQGIRLVKPTMGEAIVVTGLGLIGLVTVQLLRAHGCRVLGIDIDTNKCALSQQLGAETVDLSRGEDPLTAAQEFSRGRGVDAVIITASTKSSEPVHQAALMCRKRGRIVLVGVTGLKISRADFYQKELSFQVSCSYGPGRYDPHYEEGGQDYPLGYVRWTEQRNFEAVLDLLADGRLDVSLLVTHRFPIEQAEEAYKVVSSGKGLGIILTYPQYDGYGDNRLRRCTVPLVQAREAETRGAGPAVVGFLGAGNYAGQVLIPAFRATPARLKTVVSAKGVSAVHAGKKFGFEEASTDIGRVLDDPETTAVVIATRHDSHSNLLCRALASGKHVFVEKPLALRREELAEIEDSAARHPGQIIMVGFNRRFSPHIRKLKDLILGIREPKSFVMTVNAGAIPSEHWTQDPAVGGGRIIGEGCHFIDLMRFLSGSPVIAVQVTRLGGASGNPLLDDEVTFTLKYADGSFGTVHYLANGHKSFPKERLEVFCAGRILQLDNFRTLRGYGWPGFSRMGLWRQDKGQSACAAAFVDAIQKGLPSPIPFAELVESTRVSFEVVEALSSR